MLFELILVFQAFKVVFGMHCIRVFCKFLDDLYYEPLPWFMIEGVQKSLKNQQIQLSIIFVSNWSTLPLVQILHNYVVLSSIEYFKSIFYKIQNVITWSDLQNLV